LIPPRARSIDVLTHHHKQSVKSRSRFSLAPNSTLSSTHTDLASFHTPASSFADSHAPYESALSSPLSHSRAPSSSPPLYSHRSYCSLSTSTMSTPTAPTITHARHAAAHHLENRSTPPRPPRGPKLFFTSAKTGTGVSDVFGYETTALCILATPRLGRRGCLDLHAVPREDSQRVRISHTPR